MNEVILSTGAPATSQIYGNICLALKDYIVSRYSKDYFKYVGVTSELASTAMRRMFGRNSRKEIAKQERPSMIINPNYGESSDLPFYGTSQVFDISENGVSRRSLKRLLWDIDHELALLFKPNYDRIEFDVTMQVYTQHEQIDLYKYSENVMPFNNRPFTIPISAEAILPSHMVYYMAKCCNLKVPDEPGYDPVAIVNYLNRISPNYPITYKVRNSSGNEEFFMYYTTNLLLKLNSLSKPNGGSQKGMADHHYEITFSGTAEFNLPGSFILTGTTDRQFHGYVVSLVDSDRQGVPLFTVNNLYDDYQVSIDGFKMYTTAAIKTDKAKGETDDVPINQLLEEKHMQVLTDLRVSGNPMNTIIRFRLLEDSHDKNPNEWSINWDNYTLDIYNTNPDATYRVIIYINNMKMNEELTARIDSVKSDKNQL